MFTSAIIFRDHFACVPSEHCDENVIIAPINLGKNELNETEPGSKRRAKPVSPAATAAADDDDDDGSRRRRQLRVLCFFYTKCV